jgi:glycosyltransferase involved in cell wall biosynthesis
MSKIPLISVVVICYNQEHTIGRTIDSILNQKTEFDFEIIIGEDNSPSDKTRTVCEDYAAKYPEIIRLLPKATNKGILLNYSDCLDECKGKYVASCAGDDWWHNPDKLQIQVAFLEKNEDFGVVYTDYDTINIDTGNYKLNCNTSKDVILPRGNIYEVLIKSNVIVACTVIFRRVVFYKYVDLKEYSQQNFLMEDYPMWLEMSQHTKFEYIPVSTSSYTIANGSLCNNLNDFEKFEKFERSVLNIRKHFISKYPLKAIDLFFLEELLYNRLIYMSVKAKFYEKAKFYSRKLDKLSIRNLILKFICHTSLIKIYSKRFEE